MSTSTRPGFVIETKIGKIEATPMSLDRVYVSFGSNYDTGEPLVIRGVSIRGSAQFHRYDNGEWHIGEQYKRNERASNGSLLLNTTYEKRMALHLTRAADFSASPSEHARSIIHQVLTFTVDEWIHSVEGKAAIKEAGRLQRIEDIAAIEAEIGEAEGNVTRLKAKLAARRDRP